MMIKPMKIMLVVVAYHDYEIWQIDVKIALLNSYLIDDMYMT